MGEISFFGITEIKLSYSNRAPGYIVRLRYVNGVPSIYAQFLLKDYGGKWVTALVAALKFRDLKVRELRREHWYPKRRYDRTLTKRNTSGVFGVQRCKQSGGNRKWNGIYCWRTWWIDPKTRKVRTASFSENKYGAEEACLRAQVCHQTRSNPFR
jgi:hypothetical protein